jgi:hypothetical protein
VKRGEDNWIDADLPETESNIDFLGRQPPVADRRFFYCSRSDPPH